MGISRFIVVYFLFGILIAVLSFGLQELFPSYQILSHHYWLMLVYLFLLTLIAFFVSVLGVKRDDQIGAMTIMGGLMIKFIFALAFFLFLRLKTTDNLIVLALNFFSLYLLLTVFEVVGLLRILRHQNK